MRRYAGGVAASADECGGGCERESCAICLADFEAGEEVRLLPCLHEFCKPCIDGWIERQGLAASCPLCKRRLIPRVPGRNGADDDESEEGEEAGSEGAAGEAAEDGALAGADGDEESLRPLVAAGSSSSSSLAYAATCEGGEGGGGDLPSESASERPPEPSVAQEGE